MTSSPEYWEQKATELSRTRLDLIRASATAWAATTTSLVGVFGTVAVIKGPDTFKDLDGDSRSAAMKLIAAAAVAAFVSILVTAFAASGPAKRYRPLTGLKLAAWNSETSRRARTLLGIGRLTGIAAALLVLSAGLVATLGAPDPDAAKPPANYLVRTQAGALQCGVLHRAAGHLTLADPAGHVLLNLDSGVAEVTAVTSCP